MSLLRMQMLMMAKASVAAPIEHIGSGFSLGSGGAIALPAGAQAGDVALLVLNTNSASTTTVTVAGPTPTTEVLPATRYDSGSVTRTLSAHRYTLTSSDIASGSITVTTSESLLVVIGMDVFRGSNLVATAGSLGKGVAPKSATTAMTAPGVTTLDGAVVVYVGGTNEGGFAKLAFGAAPAGFSIDLDLDGAPSCPMVIAHREPAAAGATGAVAIDATLTSSANAGDWGAVLLTLRTAVPAIEITATLPAPTVGVAYTGSISASNVEGATGAITLSADTLPAGLSIGTRTGSGPYTWPITGTPTTAETVDSTFTATNGTQSATLVHEFVVSEPSAAPAMVQMDWGFANASGVMSATLAAPATAGNVLVLVVGSRVASTVTNPTTLGYTAGPFVTNGSFNPSCRVYYKVAAGGEQNVTLTTNEVNRSSIALYEVSGVGTTFGSYPSATNAAASGTAVALPSVTTTGPAVVISGGCWNVLTSDSQISAPWVSDVPPKSLAADGLLCAHQVGTAAATFSGTHSRTGGGGTGAISFVTVALQ